MRYLVLLGAFSYSFLILLTGYHLAGGNLWEQPQHHEAKAVEHDQSKVYEQEIELLKSLVGAYHDNSALIAARLQKLDVTCSMKKGEESNNGVENRSGLQPDGSKVSQVWRGYPVRYDLGEFHPVGGSFTEGHYRW